MSYPSTENVSSSPTATAGTTGNCLYAVHYSNNGKETNSSQLFRGKDSGYLSVDRSERCGGGGNCDREKLTSPRGSKKMGKRNIKAQVKRFRMETKAAKTLAIIVGLFILCWLPFFTIYLIKPFCDDCIHATLFSVLFWLGYCNSAINPMIYALFSKDFRFAFKRIICKCFCSGPGFHNPTGRRDSDMSQFKQQHGRTPSISPSAAAQSLCEDSDPLHDISDNNNRWRSFGPSISSVSSSGGRNTNSNSNNNNNNINSNSNSNNNNSNNNHVSTSRAPVYDICHPLVMNDNSSSYVSSYTTLSNDHQQTQEQQLHKTNNNNNNSSHKNKQQKSNNIWSFLKWKFFENFHDTKC